MRSAQRDRETAGAALRVICIAWLLVGLAGPAAALLVPVGSEFQVNSYTTNSQIHSSVAVAPDGGALIAWDSYNQDSPGTRGVFGKRYDSAGTQIGTEFQVNSYTVDTQQYPRAVSDPAGAFSVVWESFPGQDGSGSGIFVDPCPSTACMSDVQINTTTLNDQRFPATVSTAPGDEVVVWQSNQQDGNNAGVFGQRFSGMAPAGGEFQVNTYTFGYQKDPDIAAGPSGEFVVVWGSGSSQDGDGLGVFGQRFTSSGTRAGTEFQVNSFTMCDQQYPRVAVQSTGDFVVVWTSGGNFFCSMLQDGSGTGVFGQRFASNGAKLGTEFQVNTATVGYQYFPVIATAPSDEFIVVWSDSVGSTDQVSAQEFDSGGNRIGSEFQISTNGARPSIATFASGGVVAWEEGNSSDGDSYGIFARRLAVATSTATPAVSPTPTHTVPTNTATATRTATGTNTPTPFCPSSPQSGCRVPGKGSLLIKNNADDSKDKLIWKWLKGAATGVGDFGNPVGSTLYALCVYDASGRKLSVDLAPGLRWSQAGSTGFKYTGDGTGDDGARKAKLKAGADGKAKALLKASGVDLPLDIGGPTLALTLPVTAQLINNNSQCWSTTFDGDTANGPTQFKSKQLQPTPVPTATATLTATVTATATQTVTVTATPTLPPKRVFIAGSGNFLGNFGGFSVGDAECQFEAGAALLTGTYKVWLSTTAVSAASRLTHATVPYVLVDGTQVAANWTDLTDGTLDAPISLTASGSTLLNDAWTGTDASGAATAGATCSDWTSTGGSGAYGLTNSVNSDWTDTGTTPCNAFLLLYCIEQ